MKLIPLTLQHAPDLLEFELYNRTWFEQHIEPRPDDFYSLIGVQTHSAELLMDKTLGKGVPALLINQQGDIIGRVNLANIARGKAFLGYRLAEKYVGRGIAKQAVGMMLELAKQQSIQKVVALTSVENIASQKVLKSHGFVEKRKLRNFTCVQGVNKDCLEFRLDLDSN